jgi:hypothetical protein
MFISEFQNSNSSSKQRRRRSMDTLHAQKENVDANVRGGAARTMSFAGTSAPKISLIIAAAACAFS